MLISVRIFAWKRRRLTDQIMVGASWLGDGYVYGIIGILLLLSGDPLARKIALSGLVGFACELPVYLILKKTIRRVRPFQKIPGITKRVTPPDKFSFPSGHTAAAFLMATLIGSVYPVILLPAMILAFLIGFSRIYNGVHFTSDVIAGMLLGILSAETGLRIIFSFKGDLPCESPISRKPFLP
ncbi:MAG TPA: phosphatase PAP2 family protein [bacterium]|nr:phosphatase PAP2 family protein [bacterium]